MRVFAFIGLSGVGKTYFVKQLLTKVHPQNYLHLTGSDLICSQKKYLDSISPSHKNIRRDRIQDNQKLLVDAFKRKTTDFRDTVLFDGHVLIDTSDKEIKIPEQVFEAIQVRHFILLYEDAKTICERRLKDTSRGRPKRTVEEINQLQKRTISHASKIALSLSKPLMIIQTKCTEEVLKLLNRDLH